mgnify:CR=1 FL=1
MELVEYAQVRATLVTVARGHESGGGRVNVDGLPGDADAFEFACFDLGTNAVKKTKALGKPGNRYPVEITR